MEGCRWGPHRQVSEDPGGGLTPISPGQFAAGDANPLEHVDVCLPDPSSAFPLMSHRHLGVCLSAQLLIFLPVSLTQGSGASPRDKYKLCSSIQITGL